MEKKKKHFHKGTKHTPLPLPPPSSAELQSRALLLALGAAPQPRSPSCCHPAAPLGHPCPPLPPRGVQTPPAASPAAWPNSGQVGQRGRHQLQVHCLPSAHPNSDLAPHPSFCCLRFSSPNAASTHGSVRLSSISGHRLRFSFCFGEI